MNEHAGASCALSVLIVGVFAVLLHDRTPPPRPAGIQPQSTARIDVPPPRDPAREPEPPRPKIQVTRRAEDRPAPPPRPIAVPSPPATAEAVRLEGPALGPKPVVAAGPAPQEKVPARPRPRPDPSFVEVEAGETLVDVALRVYGRADAVTSLWKANRDQLAKLDSPLVRGALLRTP